jgi:hypothetical protein
LRTKNPRVAVLIGHLNFNGGSAVAIRPLVEAMAKEINTKESPVMTVATYEGWIENPIKPEATLSIGRIPMSRVRRKWRTSGSLP